MLLCSAGAAADTNMLSCYCWAAAPLCDLSVCFWVDQLAGHTVLAGKAPAGSAPIVTVPFKGWGKSIFLSAPCELQ